MPFMRKYGVLTVTGTTAIRIPIIKRAVVDFAVSADWTPAAGDVKIAIDGAAPANVTNLPTAVASGNGAYWEFILTAAELTCKQAIVTVVDAATKAIEDQSFIVETYGNASAMYAADLSAANLPANVTQLLGTAWLAPTVSGTPDVNSKQIAGVAAVLDANNLLKVDVEDVRGSVINALVSGRMDSSVGALANAVITAASIAAAALNGKGDWNTTTPPTVAQIATAIWQDLLAGSDFGTAASIGKLLKDDVDAAISSRSTYAGGAVASVTAAVTVGTNNDKTGYGLSAAYDAAKTASQAGDAMALTSGERTTLTAAIWNALTSGLTTAGSIGKRLVDFVTSLVYAAPPSAATISTQVWSEPIPGAFGAGSAGAKLNGASSAGDPWSTAIPGAYGAGQAGYVVGHNIDAAVSSRTKPADTQVTDVTQTTYAEPGQGAPPATATLIQKIGYLYKAFRNRNTQTNSAYNLFNDAGNAVDHKATYSDDTVTSDRGKIISGP